MKASVFVSFLFLAWTLDISNSFQVAPSNRHTVVVPSSNPTATTLFAAESKYSNDDFRKNGGKLQQHHPPPPKSLRPKVGSMVLAASLAFGTVMGGTTTTSPTSPFVVPVANAAEASKVIGEIKGSGLVFKDTLTIERFGDPKVKGVTLYISNFERPITEKLSKNFFSDPSAASVGCTKTGGPIAIADNINKSRQGEEVFEESRSLLFKSLRVQRIYDEETNTVVYVTFNTRLNKGDDDNSSRFKSSLCVLNLNDDTSPSTSAATAAAALATSGSSP